MHYKASATPSFGFIVFFNSSIWLFCRPFTILSAASSAGFAFSSSDSAYYLIRLMWMASYSTLAASASVVFSYSCASSFYLVIFSSFSWAFYVFSSSFGRRLISLTSRSLIYSVVLRKLRIPVVRRLT